MKRLLLLRCASLALIAATASAEARVTRIEIIKTEPFAAGQTFGTVGAYEKVVGRFRGELDPKSLLNAIIVDLDKALRNARGMVEYSTDFYILKPVDVTKGNGALFYELANRGNKGILRRFNYPAGSNDVDDAGTPNPLAAGGRPALTRTISQGNSQSGRYLRDFLYSGFNEDEAHRIVFDGAIPTVASGRTFLNYRFSQVGRINPAGHGFMFFPGGEFPFAYENQTDPFTGKSDGILARCAASNTCPKVIHLNSGTEYWQAGQSLVTTDPLGQRDTTPPSNVRIWSMTSVAHQGVNPATPKGVCAMPYNLTDYRPLLRGALVALDRWVKDGTPAPASRYPHIADGTLVHSVKLNPAIPGLAMARGPNEKPRLDFGPDVDKGIISKALPVALKDRYRVLVPSVDADGNETAGLALPDITVPTGTAMGWSVRSEFGGGTGELCYLDGAFIPFAKTKAEREAMNDPRPSLAERYRDNADYSERVKAAATALERDGYLLPEDAKRIVQRAEKLTW
jgi:hypothetical protein